MQRRWFNALIFVILGLMAFSLLAYGFHFRFRISDDPGQWGSLGDFFGGIWNPLLSFLALVILVLTLRESMAAGEAARDAARAAREQLEIARQELHDARRESRIKDCLALIEKQEPGMLQICGIAFMQGTIRSDGSVHMPDSALGILRECAGDFELLHKYLEKIEVQDPEHPCLQHYALHFAPAVLFLHGSGEENTRMKNDFVRWAQRSEQELGRMGEGLARFVQPDTSTPPAGL